MSATFRINVTEEKDAKQWLQEISEVSKITYRVTRTYKVTQKRVLFKVDMHCQHKQKPLTIKQKGLKALSKKKANPLMGELRNKKTSCKSTLRLKILQPTKREIYEESNIFLTHKTRVELVLWHDHPLHSAHVLSFCPVSNETEQSYIKLFQSGHSAASARHYYETTLMDTCEETELQAKLSDRSINPRLQDISRLYNKWRLSVYGTNNSNGRDLAELLTEEIHKYNSSNADSGGKASVQVFDRGGDSSAETETDSDTDIQPKKTKRKKFSKQCQPLIITACTPVMARVHRKIKQAGEMIFCDSTSCLEKYNCSLFILSTSSPAGGLPLGVAITSDEKETTVKNALKSLLKILPEGSFYNQKNGPQVIMTDDSSTERAALSNVWPNARLLLCTFHFLQRRWTWLYDAKNKILHEHRIQLMTKVKQLLYSTTETELNEISEGRHSGCISQFQKPHGSAFYDSM
jgi:hypothetical protein